MATMVSNADKTFKVTVGNTKGVSSSQAAGVSYGYAQVEPNHLSAQRTGAIYAQLPCKSDIEVLENGQFVKYDYPEGVVDFTGKGEWMLVFNEVKLYDGLRETYKDFALKKTDYIDGVMTPRVFKTNVGDIFTTNTIKTAATTNTGKTVGEELTVGDLLKVDTTGFLADGGNVSTDAMVWEVVKETTLPDGQPAVKIMRIK